MATGHWPLVRYDPMPRRRPQPVPARLAPAAPAAVRLHRPRASLRILARTDPEAAERLSKLAQQQVSQRWATYEEMAAHSPEWFPASGDGDPAGPENEGSSR